MSRRIQVVVDEHEAERFRRQAAVEGMTLSGWLRKLARDRIDAAGHYGGLRSMDDLRGFWKVCDAAETGREPDWDEHLDVIARSRRRGGSET
ncbi:MAG: antitoxin [bacterium]|nr:antitoxin [bacterium]